VKVADVHEALGLLEVGSIAAGVEVADAMLKAAPIELVDCFTVTPGKSVIVVHGDPASVEASVRAGRELAGATALGHLVIPFLDAQVLPAFRGTARVDAIGAVGVVETSTVATGIVAADDAVKAADVALVRVHLGRGIGGKSVVVVCGALHDVQAAVEAGSRAAGTANALVATRIVPQPHPDLEARLLAGASPADPQPPAAAVPEVAARPEV